MAYDDDAGFERRIVELKILICRNRLITARNGHIPAFDTLRERIETDPSLATPIDLSLLVLANMIRRLEAVTFDILTRTDDAEDRWLVQGRTPLMDLLDRLRPRIFHARRQLNAVRLVLAPLPADLDLPLDAENRQQLVRSSNDLQRCLETLEDCRARTQLIADQIEAKWAKEMTRSSLKLSIVATVFLPLSFVSGLLGMNVAGIPEEHNPWSFWIVTGFLILFAIIGWLVLNRRVRDLEKGAFRAASGLRRGAAEEPGAADPPTDIGARGA
jgi:zinc transporter